MPFQLTTPEDETVTQPATIQVDEIIVDHIEITSPINGPPGVRVYYQKMSQGQSVGRFQRTFDADETAAKMVQTVADLGLDANTTVYDVIKIASYDMLTLTDPATGEPTIPSGIVV
jgi:hypothetical protein